MENILLSIVVPTKNRYTYLFELVKLLDTFTSEDFELVIQDNSDDNSIFFKSINLDDHPYIHYYYDKNPLSQAGNSDQSILNSRGEYICFIGDDDGVTRYIIDAVKWMKAKNFTILKSALSIYKWPSFISPKGYDVSGSVLYNKYSCTYRIESCREKLLKLLQTGMASLEEMPKVYNGIVKRSVLDRIYNQCNTYFPGPSPDMANAVALALEEKSYVYVDYPIIIGGHSINLGSNAARYKGGIGPLDEQNFIDQKYKDEWSSRIPKIWASRTVWPESAVTALKAYQKFDLLAKIDYDVIIRKFACSHPSFLSIALQLSNHKFCLIIEVLLKTLIKPILEYKSRKRFNKEHIFGNLPFYKYFGNIIQAENKFLESLPPFNECYNEES